MTLLSTGTTTATDIPVVPIGDDSALLTRAVQITTGLTNAKPRAGQDALHRAIVAAMEGRGHTVGEAPTGSGKSFAALSAAFLAAIRRGERTVISTDSLALMAQLQDKDVPIVIEAARDLYPDIGLQAAFMKGVANYIDPAKVISSAQTLTGRPDLFRYGQLADELEKGGHLHGTEQFPGVEPGEFESLRRLVAWACRSYYDDDPNDSGDRHACPVEHSPAMWSAVSSSSSEADDGSRYAVTPKVTIARERAAGADVVITNHSILAVQSARAVPVIVGSTKLGHFEHIIVDEAHTLPGHVRAQGAAKLSGGVIGRIGRSVTRACPNTTAVLNWRDAGEHLADELDRVLRLFASTGKDGLRRVQENDRPLGDLEQLAKDWITAGKKYLAKVDDSKDVTARIRANSAKDSLDTLKQTVEALTRHRTGWARWVEQDTSSDPSKHREWWAAHVSPIDVGFLLRDNLWAYTVVDDDVAERVELSVSALSATMPSNYPFQAGMNAKLVKYPSPFTAAYARSGLYIPRVAGGAELTELTSPGWNNKPRFDVRKHALWATKQIVELVRATDGRALILTATAREGKTYTETLRRALPRVKVHSQWDGGSSTRIVREWRDDVGSVLVGTKTMMTGVDAPGETCSLVVVDRIPRSPGNPLDDARVEQINERIGDQWEAQRAVYAVDAALLLQQAVGRLIRTSSDVGLVAVLDPRLLKATREAPSPLAYPEPTRNTYMEAVRPFGQKMTTLAQAKAFIDRELQSAG